MDVLFVHYPLGAIQFFRKIIFFGFLAGSFVAPYTTYHLWSDWDCPTLCARVLRAYHFFRIMLFCMQVPCRVYMYRQIMKAKDQPDRQSVVNHLLNLSKSWPWAINQMSGLLIYWLFAFALVFSLFGRCNVDYTNVTIAQQLRLQQFYENQTLTHPLTTNLTDSLEETNSLFNQTLVSLSASTTSSPSTPLLNMTCLGCSSHTKSLYCALLLNMFFFLSHMVCSCIWLRQVVMEDSYDAAMWKRGASTEALNKHTKLITFPKEIAEALAAENQDTNHEEEDETAQVKTSTHSDPEAHDPLTDESKSNTSLTSSTENTSKNHETAHPSLSNLSHSPSSTSPLLTSSMLGHTPISASPHLLSSNHAQSFPTSILDYSSLSLGASAITEEKEEQLHSSHPSPSSSSSASSNASTSPPSIKSTTQTSVTFPLTISGCLFRSVDCSICLSSYQANDQVRYLNCAHHYHAHCVDPWLLKKKACPLCNREIDSNDTNNRYQTQIPLAQMQQAVDGAILDAFDEQQLQEEQQHHHPADEEDNNLQNQEDSESEVGTSADENEQDSDQNRGLRQRNRNSTTSSSRVGARRAVVVDDVKEDEEHDDLELPPMSDFARTAAIEALLRQAQRQAQRAEQELLGNDVPLDDEDDDELTPEEIEQLARMDQFVRDDEEN